MSKIYDFSGWATRSNIKCADGRTIMEDAFKHNDGQTVPMVWNHQHNDPTNVLGHALLENRKDGVYAYCTFNDTSAANHVKESVKNGDIEALSIYANRLKQQGGNVVHGAICEVSLVLAGANPGAFIDSVMMHGEESDEEATIFTDEKLSLFHADQAKNKAKANTDAKVVTPNQVNNPDTNNTTNSGDETVADVFDTLSEKQKTVVYALIGQAIGEVSDTNQNGGDGTMKQNVFDKEGKEDVLSHADIGLIITDAKRYGSLKEAVLAHGITNIDYLFPDAQNVTNTPQFIQRDMGWVQKVMAAVHNTPFSRIKSTFADITEADARAKGYVKGNLKVEEVFSLLKRTTSPTTVYKKQKLDRDDVIDITDFDVVAWLKAEMRLMLDEEIVRAVLVGDGRLSSSDDKINEGNIRPIWTDDDLYTIKTTIAYSSTDTSSIKAKAFIQAAVKSRKNYKGSGSPTLYCTEDILTDCLLMEDSTGRVIYDSVDKLTTALRVKEIITVPVMEDLSRTGTDTKTYELAGIIVNLSDYNVGADKGGAVNMFDDFDIDYNAQKYLIETRCSGAMVKPYGAIALEFNQVAAG